MQATSTNRSGSLPPHGGELRELLSPDASVRAKLAEEALTLVRIGATPRQLCDLELLLNGGFSPLTGFLNEEDYNSVCANNRLVSGLVWPMPITFDVSDAQANQLKVGQKITLVDNSFGEALDIAILTVESIYKPDKSKEAQLVYGADDLAHPAVTYLHKIAGSHYIGGSVAGIQLPPHFDFPDMRKTPRELRQIFSEKCWGKITAFQTRNPMHRSHRELTVRASREAHSNLLIHPVVGMTKPGDVDHFTRVRCYQKMMLHYPQEMAMLSLLPLAMRMGGPREAVWHAIIRKNYGATHFIVGRDHAGPGNNSQGKQFYGNYEAQELVQKFAGELGITMLDFRMVVYVEETGEYLPEDEVPAGMRVLNISGTELRRRLFLGLDIPEWFSFPEVIQILRQVYPPKRKQGFALFFTGYSCSGKSQIAKAMESALLEEGSRSVSMLTGKRMRDVLSAELGYSKEDRSVNLKRISFVASEIVKAGGIAILAAIAPYRDARAESRKSIGEQGGFVEVYVNTPLEECEKRDRRGLYASARRGEISDYTGVNDPYEPPEKPDLTFNCAELSTRQCVNEIMIYLANEGYVDRV
eukprot:TRINITY_DN2749_c0_g1_i2.p1 TRINITY_DN2749_c0_g1~~TRINITY_DN2749_c0_g1_i2.p1  ORF type:complete len:584 (+),score=105.01 TRINITY_DN2749_c0_g1_i2:131-1882(+)